ncbi:OmpA family protein [Vibrio sp. JPW-9-11-11]|uniref:OmpA family protein n=1 Tax=Vibrio sp. JPW-9-11-11 TaxID=1416532 RepID=UPI001594BDA5|nr:OmpA family protein [Vibrio sp. JPW-9-11-11]NVD06767.1 OmpA family protein [Vibrio sp. JPW-9-11-11]
MKMKQLIPYALVAAIACAAAYAEDEYNYIDTPMADQISDLTDDDRDGVVNARDLCPGTPLAAKVDNDGCGVAITEQEERELRILFANDSYEINPIFASQIQTMADFLKQYQSASIQIQGYASKVGNPDYNLELSKKRAHAVEDRLLSYDIDPKRVAIVGYGEDRLEAQGDDETSHALNRRVTAKVVGLKEDVIEEWTIFTIIEK